jgi:DNA-binding SARP family transcriptional activator
VEFRILGPLEVVDEGRVLVLRGAKERAVLAFLLLHAGQVVSSDRLIDELWGEERPDSARQSLRVRIAGLRKALGPDRIATRPSGYQLSIERDALDLDRFQRLLGESEAMDPAAAAELLREAVELWRGPPLADFRYEPWAQAAIARLEELRLLALEKRIDAELAAGRHAQAAGELEALVLEHPLRERFRAQLMLALYRAGRGAEALDAYQSTRRRFVEELGIEPGQALRELERAILKQEPSLELERPAVALRSILVVALADRVLDRLLGLAQPLVRRPLRELILVRPVPTRSELTGASADLQRRRELLLADGVVLRTAAFSSTAPAPDVVRIATDQDVDLVIIDGPSDPLEDPVLVAVLQHAPCDVAVVAGGALQAGPVLVPFVGAEHDWSAVEIGAWLARSLERPLRLAGPGERGEGPRDASRLLADASLAVQRALGVPAEPLIVEPCAEELVRAAREAGVVVAGLSDRWQKDGLGPVRSALVTEALPSVLLVRRGLRPGGLAPPESHTRFTWTIRAAT